MRSLRLHIWHQMIAVVGLAITIRFASTLTPQGIWMTTLAVVVPIGACLLWKQRSDCRDRCRRYADLERLCLWQIVRDGAAGANVLAYAEYYSRMRIKYLYAYNHPWASVEPDPPPPKLLDRYVDENILDCLPVISASTLVLEP